MRHGFRWLAEREFVGTLLVIPCGGLGNRLMAMLSARLLAEQIGCGFHIVWRSQSWLPLSEYPLGDIFEDVDAALWTDPVPASAFCVDHHSAGPRPEVEARLRAGETVALTSYCFIKPSAVDRARFRSAIRDQFARLRPHPAVLARVEAPAPPAIGIQIRRGDNWRSILYSPLGLFFRIADRALREEPNLSIFLATDSDDVLRQMRRRYGARLRHHTARARIDPRECARDALADIIALSRANRLYTSGQSSFGFVAHLMTGVPAQVVHVPWMSRSWNGPWVVDWHDRYLEWDWATQRWRFRRPIPKALSDGLRAGWIRGISAFARSRAYQFSPLHRPALGELNN